MRHERARKFSPRQGGPFARFARAVAEVSGKPVAFGFSVLIILTWLVTGPIFGFSDTWQLVINTGTTIITFLMVFLIQNTQNRDTRALQIKLDEVLRAMQGAHTALIDLEELTDEELILIKARYLEIANQGRELLRAGKKDTGRPDLHLG